MKIIADENIPFVRELFSPLGEVTLKPGRQMTADDVRNAQVLLVRSVTKVNKNLIQDANLQFVGTCTIGCDHLDTEYLHAQNISYASAPGCNANAVVQYVVSVLAALGELNTEKSVTIVGGGNVGSRVYRALSSLGFQCQCVDPFLDDSCGLTLAPFSAVYDADIVCLHAPYTDTGPHPTRHMFAYDQIAQLKPGALLVSAGRGGVVNNTDLLRYKSQVSSLRLALDVWENEPSINKELLLTAEIGTPHIAGYSFEGRVTGSLMIFDALCRHLDVDVTQAAKIRKHVTDQAFADVESMQAMSLAAAVLQVYDVRDDDLALKNVHDNLQVSFDALRKNYPKRREYSHYSCAPEVSGDELAFQGLGFLRER